MRCPRCTLAELSESTETCGLCGYSSASVAVAVAPPPPQPAGPTELDARRELGRDFRIDTLLEAQPGQIVYLAYDAQDRLVTLKVVPRAQVGAAADRFDVAAEAASRLDHPHIVPHYGHGATENFLWCATKHVNGRTLGTIVGATGPIELSVCVRILEQVASALDHAHRRGMAHGALTLDCIVVDANQWALLTDFAWTGMQDSTPSPEADQRALAFLAYECLTGSRPPEGRLKLDGGDPALPLHVSQALRRALSKRPADRFASVLDFVAALGGGGARSDGRKAWFSANPRKTPGNAPVVIVDADADPAASRVGARIAAVLVGLIIVGAGGAAWLGISSIPAVPAAREPDPPRATPPTAPPVAAATAPSSASRDTLASSPVESSPPLLQLPSPAPRRPVETPPQRATPRPAERHQVTLAPAPAPAPARSSAPALVEPGLLSVNAIPWGSVYLDGQPIGNTPQIDRTVQPGEHRLRVEREGFKPYDRMIQVAPGQRLRITDIALVER